MTALHLRAVVLPDGVVRDLFVAGGTLTFEEPTDATTVLDGGWLVPGLVDAHAHLGLASPAPPDASPRQRARASARAQLEAGVLLVREPGGPDRASAGIGPVDDLPRTLTAGRFLASPGGYFPGLAREVGDADLADAAEDEARASGAWAKVIADFIRGDGRLRLNFSPAALAEAVRRVHAAGGRLAVHTSGPDAITVAIEAGVDSIEHGYGLTDDHIAAMAAAGTAFVPTLSIGPDLPCAVARLGGSPDTVAGVEQAVQRHGAAVRQAAEAGVTVLAGTDAGMGPHGRIGTEIRHLLDAGLTADAALGAGSWAARRYLGLPGIEQGAPADLVAYPDDPRGDAAVLASPSLVLLDGRIVLGSPGVPDASARPATPLGGT